MKGYSVAARNTGYTRRMPRTKVLLRGFQDKNTGWKRIMKFTRKRCKHLKTCMRMGLLCWRRWSRAGMREYAKRTNWFSVYEVVPECICLKQKAKYLWSQVFNRRIQAHGIQAAYISIRRKSGISMNIENDSTCFNLQGLPIQGRILLEITSNRGVSTFSIQA